jgi:hypothetical protein
MSSIDNSKSFEQQIAEASTPAQLREICINREVAKGNLKQDRDGSVHPVVEPAPAAPAPPTHVDNDWGFSRVVYVGNSRFELNASSKERLDDQESRIRAAFAGQK